MQRSKVRNSRAQFESAVDNAMNAMDADGRTVAEVALNRWLDQARRRFKQEALLGVEYFALLAGGRTGCPLRNSMSARPRKDGPGWLSYENPC